MVDGWPVGFRITSRLTPATDGPPIRPWWETQCKTQIQTEERPSYQVGCLMADDTKHCQRHNGPEDWVLLTKVTYFSHITRSNTKFDQISSSEYWPSTSFKISTSANRKLLIQKGNFASTSQKYLPVTEMHCKCAILQHWTNKISDIFNHLTASG